MLKNFAFWILVSVAVLAQGRADEVLIKRLLQTYSGANLRPLVEFKNQPREASLACRLIEPGDTVFDNTPGFSYGSYAFQASRTSALGNLVQLAASTSRVVDHVEVVMSSWAKPENFPSLSQDDPSGYQHPVTATIYEITNSGGVISLIQIEQSTAWIHIPWRPSTYPDGSEYTPKGFPFKALIPLSAARIVPEQCVIAIGFNTQSAGTSPIGISGPYDSLNLALSTAAAGVGGDVNTNAVFRINDKGEMYYPAVWNGFGSPMLRLGCRPVALVQPAIVSPFVTAGAGTYHVRARILPEEITADAVLTIAKAPIRFETTGLVKSIRDSDPFISVTNQSPGLTADITYNGSRVPPRIPGRYPFLIEATDPNHIGRLTGEFRLTAVTYDQWAESQNTAVGAGDGDSDSDGTANWLEYATGSDPMRTDQDLQFETSTTGELIRFKKRLEMPNVRLLLESSDDLIIWKPANTVKLTTDDEWEYWSFTSNLKKGYFRLRANID